MIAAASNLVRLPFDLVSEYAGYPLRIAASVTDAFLMSAFPAPAQRRAANIASAGLCTSREQLMDWARLERLTRSSPVDGEASPGRPLGPATGERRALPQPSRGSPQGSARHPKPPRAAATRQSPQRGAPKHHRGGNP
jgi:hypothetical protein